MGSNRRRREKRRGKSGKNSTTNLPLLATAYLPEIDEYTWLDQDTFNLYSYATIPETSVNGPVSPTASAVSTAPESTTSTKLKLSPHAPVFVPKTSTSPVDTIENSVAVLNELEKKARDNWSCDFCGWECFCAGYV